MIICGLASGIIGLAMLDPNAAAGWVECKYHLMVFLLK